ncbi:MAG: hypothetical protein V4773_03510 [Verrucomicrobiota bacterium]
MRWPLAGFAAAVLFLALVARFWHPVYAFTSFYQLDVPDGFPKISAFSELPVYVHFNMGGYDGLYYAQLAHDPTLRDPELRTAMDDFSYRARRILAPALAWLLGAGQPRWIIHTYALLNVAAWLVLAAVLWRILKVDSFRGWFAWMGLLFSAGALCSVRLALTDVLAVLLIAAALHAADRQRGRLAVALVAASSLARETGVLAVAGLCQAPWISRKNILRVALAAAPLAAWFAYVRFQVGPGNPGWGNFTMPVAGLLEKWRESFGALGTVADKQIAWGTFLATIAITAQAVFFLTRWAMTDRWWRLGISYTVLLLLLGTAVWEGFPGAATRVLLPLHLAFTVFAHRARASFWWLILGNLSLFSGLVTLRDVPREPSELVAQNLGPTVAVVRFQGGWFARESDRRHVWLWSDQRGLLDLETIPPSAQPLRMDFSLRSLTPRRVILRVEGKELWRGEIGPARTHHSVILPAALPRHTELEFSTDTPPTLESPAPGARPLAFALYSIRVSLGP